MKSRMRLLKTLSFGGFLLLLFLFQACSKLPEKIDLLSSVELIETPDYISIYPKGIPVRSTSILFHTGGLVDPHAYISLLQYIVAAGYPVVIAKPIANLGILGSKEASFITRKFPNVKNWVIGGHSLGAVVAGKNVYKEPHNFKGLILLAGYPTKGNDISNWSGAVLSISASNDGLATRKDIDDNKKQLPLGIPIVQLTGMPIVPTNGKTIYHEIEGGIHAYFGAYGAQKNDGTATITRSAQHQEVVNFILSFLKANNL